MSYKSIIIVLAFMVSVSSAKAQTTSDERWEVDLKLGINIGGAAPLSMPQEIRKLEDYNPKFNGSIEATATHWYGETKKWGVSIGLKLERKGMKTGATVKNYHTELIQGEGRIAGYYTGYVKTDYSETLLTIPVLANYRISDRWKVRAGMFGSIKLAGKFEGYVSEGYLREDIPTGTKIAFDKDEKGYYNFNSDLRNFHYGAQLGGSWQADKHISLNADLTWTFSDVFMKKFKTISFALHPVYLNLGVGYRL